MSRRPRILAAVDLGTNSVKLLVARVGGGGSPEPVHQQVVITRIGEGLTASHRLSPAAVERTWETLEHYAATAQRLGAERVRAIATSALRDAADGEEFIERLRRRTGWEIEVISGRREAELGFLGAAAGARPRERRVVFDVGGGSAQVSAGAERVDWSHSFPLGAVRLTERFLPTNPVPAGDLARLRDHARAVLEPAREALAGDALPVVGIGGAVACLTALDLCARDPAARPTPDGIQGRRLSRAAVERMLRLLAERNVEERKRMPGMDPGRADVIVGGGAAVAEILTALGARTLRVSTTGIRFGLLVEMARE